jgi:hypothetical protein
MMAFGGSGDVDVKGLAMPFVMMAALVGLIAVFGKWGLAGAVSFWSAFIAALVLWSVQQHQRAKREIRSRIERSGSKIIRINYRHLRLGPFSIWNTSRSQLVYRAVVQEATGRERIVWARWGRRWFWEPDTLELKWQE